MMEGRFKLGGEAKVVVVEENRIGEKGMKVMEDSIESELVENEKI